MLNAISLLNVFACYKCLVFTTCLACPKYILLPSTYMSYHCVWLGRRIWYYTLFILNQSPPIFGLQPLTIDDRPTARCIDLLVWPTACRWPSQGPMCTEPTFFWNNSPCVGMGVPRVLGINRHLLGLDSSYGSTSFVDTGPSLSAPWSRVWRLGAVSCQGLVAGVLIQICAYMCFKYVWICYKHIHWHH